MKKSLKKSGFTLIELLVVIGILAILLSIVLIAINPARQFAQANITKRRSDTVAILNAVSQYIADNHGTLPPQITTTATDIGNITGANPAMIDLCTLLTQTVQYLPALPSDPKGPMGGAQIPGGAPYADCTKQYDTGYQISKDANNRVTVSGNPLYQELATPVTVTR